MVSANALVKLLRRQRIATLSELMAELGTNVERTTFRKLKELPYRTSYSHRGRYYTLDDIAEFDARGLWSFRSVSFSIWGTLLATAEVWVDGAEAGYYVDELDSILHVITKDALPKLVRDGRLTREKLSGRYLYCSAEPTKKNHQLLARSAWQSEIKPGAPLPGADIMPGEMKAAIVLFFSMLDEKQRRLYAGLESLKFGHGGDRKVACLLGLDVGMISRGRQQLLAQDVEVDRVRKAGGGRKRVEKKRLR